MIPWLFDINLITILSLDEQVLQASLQFGHLYIEPLHFQTSIIKPRTPYQSVFAEFQKEVDARSDSDLKSVTMNEIMASYRHVLTDIRQHINKSDNFTPDEQLWLAERDSDTVRPQLAILQNAC